MSDRKPLPGKFVWFEHLSRDPKKAQGFYGGVLGWKVAPFPMGEATYDIPGVGRFGVMADPTGAMLAIIKPLPTETQP